MFSKLVLMACALSLGVTRTITERPYQQAQSADSGYIITPNLNDGINNSVTSKGVNYDFSLIYNQGFLGGFHFSFDYMPVCSSYNSNNDTWGFADTSQPFVDFEYMPFGASYENLYLGAYSNNPFGISTQYDTSTGVTTQSLDLPYEDTQYFAFYLSGGVNSVEDLLGEDGLLNLRVRFNLPLNLMGVYNVSYAYFPDSANHNYTEIGSYSGSYSLLYSNGNYPIPYSPYYNIDFPLFEFNYLHIDFTAMLALTSTGESYQGGYDTGYSTGYSTGYENGFRDGQGADDTTTNFSTLMFTIADVPIYYLKSLFNIQLFGVKVYTAVLSLVTVLFVLYLIKKIV